MGSDPGDDAETFALAGADVFARTSGGLAPTAVNDALEDLLTAVLALHAREGRLIISFNFEETYITSYPNNFSVSM